jgi:hypothetical protein
MRTDGAAEPGEQESLGELVSRYQKDVLRFCLH